MKKIFLIPLLACFSCVMAWAEGEVVVNDFATLKTQLSASGTAEVVKLGQDITYEGSAVLDIQRSLTLDGDGHQIIGFKKTAIKTDGTSEQHWTSIAVNAGQFGSTAELNVTIKNISLGNTNTNARYYGIIAFDGVKNLTLDNIYIDCGDYNVQQPICFTGTSATPIILTVKDSYVNSGNSAYPFYVLKPITATITNTVFEGWCSLYFKYRNTTLYGDVVGARGSSVIAENCTFNTMNVHHGSTNGFAVFPIEDDGITLDLRNCSMNAQRFTEQSQSLISLQSAKRTSGFQKVSVSISGDNTHIYNVDLNALALTGWNGNDDENTTTYVPKINVPFEFNISGGTFTVNPRDIVYHTYVDGTTFGVANPFIDPEVYDVNQVSQGGEPVWRVVKIAKEKTPGVKYDLNDLVTGEGVAEGNNPVSSFDLSTGSEMTLNQETTTAGYVEVKDNGSNGTTVTVGKDSGTDKDQKLIINNGLDVQGNSKVEVKVGSTLEIGEGGIVTEKPENIVIGADENGAASLLLDPTITVNQTPNLTVKMKAKSIGWMMNGASAKEYYWHRFALPIQQASTWVKNPNKSTYVFGWNYSNDSWEQLSALTQMVPFKGYTLSADYENLGDVEYTFTGQLAGNTNNLLEFERNGFNFFGNSYTGYIDILALVEQIMGDNKIDGSVWVWGGDQNYHVVPLLTLRDGGDVYATEIAPMQTFILKQNGSENASAELNYASAVWGNPRYGHSVTPAPSRNIADETTRMRIIVTAENGKSDFVMFTEDAKFSDSFEKGYDGEKYMNENALNMFATVNGANYTAIATDNLEGKMITINTVEAVNYTMSFAKVNGEEYAIRDNATGKVIAIQEGATYEFAAQPNSTVEGRFQIVMRDKVTTAIENTEVKANVKGIYTLMGQYVGEDFNTLPAGVYVVDGVKIVK